MPLSQSPPTLLSLLFVAFSHIPAITAIPFDLHEFGFAWLQDRGYGNCGADLQYTCTGGQSCSTTVNAAGTPIAFCGAAAAAASVGGGGGYSYAVYTTTYTETDLILRTSTYTSSWQAAATTSVYVAPAPAICTPSLGQQSCGVICCASTQACAGSGWCTDTATSLWSYTAPAPTVTSTYSAPLRPTSGGVTTATSVVSATTTQPFIAPATASGSTLPVTEHSSSGLSGGAIAGIVIGVIAGIIILLLICFCCCLKAGFDGLLALFGLGKRRRRSTEKIETVERYSRHGSGTASRRDTHTGWFGRSSGPTRVTEERKKSSSGFGGLGAVGAGLIGLAVLLGLKRRHDRKEKVARSEVHSSYYTDSYTGTSASSASSDRRTRNSRRH